MHQPGRTGFGRNLLQIIGHVGQDPQPTQTRLGLRARFPVAVNRGQYLEWFQVHAYRALATESQRRVRKGQLVYVEGALRIRRYEDRDGRQRVVSALLASQVQVHPETGGSLNRWLAVGRFGADPVLHYSALGVAYVELSIGADIPRPEQEYVSRVVDWIPVALWGADAEQAALRAARGRTVVADGYARSEQWETDEGEQRSRWRLIPTERLRFIGTREHWDRRAARARGGAREAA